jgi:hypothetical protein
MDLTGRPNLGSFDHRFIPLDHRGHLLALIGVDDEYHLVMTHLYS